MGKRKIEYYVCDRCHKEIDKPFSGGESGTFRATFSADFAVTGYSVEWTELCADCNRYIGDMIDGEVSSAKESRAKVEDHTND